MRIPLLSVCLLLLATFAFSQTVNLGIKAGGNLSTQSRMVPVSGFLIDDQNKTGYQAGVTADIGFEHISIEPGMFFITKGEKFRDQFTEPTLLYSETGTGFIKLNYLEVPVNVLYKLQAAPLVKIYAGGGPYFGFGLSGKGTTAVIATESGGSSTTNTSANYNIKFGTDKTTDDYKNPDYGINFVAGVQLKKHYTIDLNYGLGLANLTWGQGYSIKNRTLGLSVGYLFR